MKLCGEKNNPFKCAHDSSNQWRWQNFNLEGTKSKDNIKSEINLKNITQQ